MNKVKYFLGAFVVTLIVAVIGSGILWLICTILGID